MSKLYSTKDIQDAGHFLSQIRKSLLGMLGLLDAEPEADSSIPSPPTLYHDEEAPIPHAVALYRRLRYSDPASSSSPLRLCLTPQLSKSYRDIPSELWYHTFEFLVPADVTCPTHRTLVHVRGVCRSWREIAERLMWEGMKSLVASPRLFESPSDDFPRNLPHEIQLWLEDNLAHLAEGHKRDARRGSDSGGEFRLVAFHFDERYHPDQNLAKFFVSALSNCVCAEITIDHFPTSTNPFSSSDAHGIRSLPSIPLRQFSFFSMDLGISDTLPQQFDFPWHSLRQDLPWSQTSLWVACFHMTMRSLCCQLQ